MKTLFAFTAFSLLFTNIVVAQESNRSADVKAHETVTFESGDGLKVTADLYLIRNDQNEVDKSNPFIVLCHQAGWSRGEYLEIAPKLNKLGFNCMAIDQRSGGRVNEVKNETVARATDAKLGTDFPDAEQDMIAAIRFAKEKYAKGKIVLWGSSYSSALAIRIAGENADMVDGVMAFAPGEYFKRFGKPADWIETSAKKIKVPAFITSAKNELGNWESIFAAIPVESKTKFLPNSAGNHGARALWEKFDDHEDYWNAVEGFLKNFSKS